MKNNLVLLLLNLLGLVLFIATWSPLVWGIYMIVVFVLSIALFTLMHLKGKAGEFVRKYYWKLIGKREATLGSKAFPVKLETSIVYFINTDGELNFIHSIKKYNESFRSFLESELENYCK
jgi:hypothetical protein